MLINVILTIESCLDRLRKELFLKKYLFYFLICFSSLLAGNWNAEAATIRISAPKVILELSPGETYSGEIVAENPTEDENKVKIYLEDWAYQSGGTGEKRFAPAGTTPLSASKWINFSPAQDVIKPYGRVTVHYTISVPANAKGAYYSVLFFETVLGASTDEDGVNVLVAGRIGSLFFIEIKGIVDRKGEIQSVELKAPEGNKPMEIHTVFHNTGNTDITLAGNFLIMDSQGKVQGRGDLNKIYTFPGDTGVGTTQWVGRLLRGDYQVLLTYNLGKGKSLVEEKTLTIT